MIEPLANQTHSQGHAVYNAQSLKLPAGTCGHHHGDGNHTESLQELIDVMAEPQQTNRVRSWFCCVRTIHPKSNQRSSRISVRLS